MPVTAKLSRKFYERLGDDIATELVDWFNAVDSTYQTQLREINDLNWERFRSEMRGVETGLRAEIKAVEQTLRTEIKAVEQTLRAEIKAVEETLRAEMKAMEERLLRQMAELKSELLKWMFIYWTGTMLTVAGLLFAFLKMGQK